MGVDGNRKFRSNTQVGPFWGLLDAKNTLVFEPISEISIKYAGFFSIKNAEPASMDAGFKKSV